ncbi:MAG: hypothetical protein QY318_02000 [Candidatus Dojkabacteria bacterium]|nr:MAG: hypothetical protein QY318_02000 [Candidatus Dojkabacteria bacterium]
MNRVFLTLIIVLLTVVAIAWSGITLYDTVSSVEVTPGVESQLRPISSSFDSEILDEIETRTDNLEVPPEDLLKIEEETLQRIEELKSEVE